MTDVNKIPYYILSDLRERGLSDDYIGKSSPEELFEEFCNWNGLIGWGPTLVRVLDALRAAA